MNVDETVAIWSLKEESVVEMTIMRAEQMDDTYQQYLFWFGCIQQLHQGRRRDLLPLPHARFKAYYAYWANQVYRYLCTGLTNRVPGMLLKPGRDVQIERAVCAARVGS